MTHTPGPWHTTKGPIRRTSTWTVTAKSPRSGHGRVYDIATINGNPEAKANARLIAAAPDLLAALEQTPSRGNYETSGEFEDAFFNWHKTARAAIKAAKE